MVSSVTAETARFCYIDLDVDRHRKKVAVAAAFCNATDTRYGFSSPDLRCLGGSELARIPDLIRTDHEWSNRCTLCECRPPAAGNRIILELFWDVAPLACENFATLCGPMTNEAGKVLPPATGACGKPLTYKNSMVHRVIPGFIIQAGDFVFGNGSAGESVFGKKFKDERNGLLQKHNQRGVLSMGNAGKNSNTSQFFLTFQAAPQCDGKHVVFGRVVSGWQVVDAVEAVGTTGGEPSVPIEITDCGIFTPLSTPGAGYWYDQPNGESYTGTSPVFMVRPRVAVVAPNVSVGDKFVKAVGDYCSVVTVLQANQDETAILNQVSDLLKSFAVDVVLVAPACRDLVPNIKLNPLWNSHASSEGFPVGQVVMEAKPVEALSTIRTQSWLAKITPWQLDGTIQ